MDRKLPVVVSHYTVGTGYEQEVRKLQKSLQRFKLDYDLEPIKVLGSWRTNSNYVARNVQRALELHLHRNILRVDADAVFRASPDIFLTEKFDDVGLAAHVHEFKWCKRELLGGTLYFANSPAVRWLVNDWVDWCMVSRVNERPGDLLQELLDSGKYGIKFVQLPATYCQIFDIMKNEGNPVIEHFQASRRFRKIMDRANKERMHNKGEKDS